MSIALEKLKKSSNRFTLVRLEPARYLNDDLVSEGSGIYSVTFNDINDVSRITRNGTELTKTTGVPTSNDEYAFNEVDKTLVIKIASAPDIDSNVIICFHYLYLTTEKGRYYGIDPVAEVSDLNPSRFWEPRIQRPPTIEESYSNIFQGVLTVKGSTLSLINMGGFLNPYLTKKDSFVNKDIKVYIGINESVELLFTGPMNDVSIDRDTASISFRDAFSLLDQVAIFNESEQNIFFNNDEYYSVDPKFLGKPKITNIGNGTPASYEDYSIVRNHPTLYEADKKFIKLGSCNEAVNIDYSASTLTTRNRDFFICNSTPRVKVQSVSGLIRSTTSLIRSDTVHHYYFSEHNLNVGQTFRWDDGGGPYASIVQHVGDHTIGGQTYNVMIGNNDAQNLTDPIMTTTSDFDFSFPITLALFTTGQVTAYTGIFLKFTEDYTLSNSTSGDYSQIKVTLDSSVPFDPAEDLLLYQIDFDGTGTFPSIGASTVQRNPSFAGASLACLIGAGVNYNSQSFADLANTVDLKARLQNPLFQSETLLTYRQILELILGSSLSYLSQNEDGEAIIDSLSAIASGDLKDDKNILDGSLRASYKYNDIFQRFLFKNIHDNDQGLYQNFESAVSNKSKYLHGQDKFKEIKHVLDDISSLVEDQVKLRSSRRGVYSYTTATDDVDQELGSDVTIDSGNISSNIKITSIKKTPRATTISGEDLGDL